MKKRVTAVVAGAVCAMTAQAVWNGAAGDAQYLNTGNWENDEIDNSFYGVAPVPYQVSFSGNHTATNDLNLMQNYNQTLVFGAVGGNWTLTLGGDILAMATNGIAPLVCFGNTPSYLFSLDLGGASRSIWAGSATQAREVQIFDGIHGTGNVTKEGAGMLYLGARNGPATSTFTGDFIINQGRVHFESDNALSPNNANIYVNAGGVVSLNGGSGSTTRRFIFEQGGTIYTAAASAPFSSILKSDTAPIVKTGPGRFQMAGQSGNEFSNGLIVSEGAILVLGGNIGGANLEENEIVAAGGVIVLAGGDFIGSEQHYVVDTTDPTKLSGMGMHGGRAIPNFILRGDNPGVIVLDNVWTALPETDPVTVSCLQSGWYLGSLVADTGQGGRWNGGFTGTTMAVGPDKTYRFANPNHTDPATLHVSQLSLTGDNNLVVGSPTALCAGSTAFYMPQDYTGFTRITGMGMNLMTDDSVLSGTSEVWVKSTPRAVAALRIYGNSAESGSLVQRMPATSPLTLSGATLYISPSVIPAGRETVHGVGDIVLLSGRNTITQGRTSGFDQEFYLRTVASS
ncbi:MAG: hypothetical protein FWF84_03060, partial [Kiritimatiellaeota bacterium]|nr:hypothetical protein [Kiritimatiellota bacterium]